MSLNATPRGAPLLISPETPSIPQARLLAAQLPFRQDTEHPSPPVPPSPVP